MLFSSFSFLFWFLPVTLLLYFLPPSLFDRLRKGERSGSALPWQNGVLLAASLLFYAWGEPLYLFLMVGVILADTLLGILIARAKHKKSLLALAVAFHIGLLFYYKYVAFFAHVMGFSITAPRLPLGI